MRLQGAAAALVQLLLVVGALVFWRIGEKLIAGIGQKWIFSGARTHADRALAAVGLGLGSICAVAVLIGIAALAVWSFAGFWGYPDVWPNSFSAKNWIRHGPGTFEALGETAIIGITVTLLALVLTIGCLEAEHRFGISVTNKGLWLLYLPLLVPQIAFLPGLQTLLLRMGADVGRFPVMAAHLVFVLPYVFLSLADPFRAWDSRYSTISSALGASQDRVLWHIRMPMLLRPTLTAMAVGFAVSVGQYLPTLLIGGGRVSTLTTEAVALASGGDRRAIGVYGLMQTSAALLPFALAILIPAIAWRNRKGFQNG